MAANVATLLGKRRASVDSEPLFGLRQEAIKHQTDADAAAKAGLEAANKICRPAFLKA